MGLANNTPIPTPDGWINVGDIGIDQRAFDERGDLPCAVVGLHPQGEQLLYRVSFDRSKDQEGNETEDTPFILAGLLQPWVPLTHSLRAKIHKGTRSLDHWASCPRYIRGLAASTTGRPASCRSPPRIFNDIHFTSPAPASRQCTAFRWPSP